MLLAAVPVFHLLPGVCARLNRCTSCAFYLTCQKLVLPSVWILLVLKSLTSGSSCASLACKHAHTHMLSSLAQTIKHDSTCDQEVCRAFTRTDVVSAWEPDCVYSIYCRFVMSRIKKRNCTSIFRSYISVCTPCIRASFHMIKNSGKPQAFVCVFLCIHNSYSVPMPHAGVWYRGRGPGRPFSSRLWPRIWPCQKPVCLWSEFK